MQIFLSFAYDEDVDQVNGFRAMLENPNADIDFTDGSCKKDYSDKPESAIRRYIRTLLDQSSVTVCLISARTRASQWVAWEVEETISKAKGLVGIVLKGRNSEIKSYQDCPSGFDGKRYVVHYWDSPEKMQQFIEEAERAR